MNFWLVINSLDWERLYTSPINYFMKEVLTMTTMPLFVEELIPWMKDETYDGIVKVAVNHCGEHIERVPIVKYINKRCGTLSYMMLYPRQMPLIDNIYCICREFHAIMEHLKRKFKKYDIDSEQFIKDMFTSEMGGQLDYFDEDNFSMIELWTYHDDDTMFMKNYQDLPLNSLQDLRSLFQHICSDLHELYKNELISMIRTPHVNQTYDCLYHNIVSSYFVYTIDNGTFRPNKYSKYIDMICDWFYAATMKQSVRNIPTIFSSECYKDMLIPVRTETGIKLMTSAEYRDYRDQQFSEYCRRKVEEWEELEKELEDDED